MEVIAELLTPEKSSCVSDPLLEELNKNVLWLLQQQGVINTGSMEFHSMGQVSILGKIFGSRMRPVST